MANELAVQKYITNESVQSRAADLLQDRAKQFTTSLLSVVNSNSMIARCKPETVFNAALTAASMDLPINQNFGFAAMVPYKNRAGEYEAQFQMMTRGYIQLAQRSSQYKTISCTPVFRNQLKSIDPLRGFVFDWDFKPRGSLVGYAAYFELINGFEKTLYMTIAEVDKHARRYSSAYKEDLRTKSTRSLWTNDFDKMALKTVLKMLISKYGPLSVQMQRALEVDQAIITDEGLHYVDNVDDEAATDEEKQAIINAAKQPAKEDKDVPVPTEKS
jgi:recombination protein RecT